MVRAFRAGATYFLLVFAAGLTLGVVRGAILVPQLGEVVAVRLEVPVILGVAWLACGVALRRTPVPQGLGRLLMGASAFALLMSAEALLATAMGISATEWFAAQTTAHGRIGLAAQIVFGLIPLARRGG